jgi:hypothetical protein
MVQRSTQKQKVENTFVSVAQHAANKPCTKLALGANLPRNLATSEPARMADPNAQLAVRALAEAATQNEQHRQFIMQQYLLNLQALVRLQGSPVVTQQMATTAIQHALNHFQEWQTSQTGGSAAPVRSAITRTVGMAASALAPLQRAVAQTAGAAGRAVAAAVQPAQTAQPDQEGEDEDDKGEVRF